MAKTMVPMFGEDEATAMLAKAIALFAFRNPLEHLHGGATPRSETGDYSDVKVVTPDGEIPWSDIKRISEDEMKVLMIDVVSKLFTLLADLDDKSVQARLSSLAYGSTARWDAPEIDELLREAVLRRSIGTPKLEIVETVVGMIKACDARRRAAARGK
jgi:hypothetical protein